MPKQQICIPDYFIDAPEQTVRNRLSKIGRRDEKLQVRLINLSLTIAGKLGKERMDSERKKSGFCKSDQEKNMSADRLFSICEKLAGLIIENVYEDEEGKLQVLSIDLSEQCRSKIRRVTHYFYEGIAGIVVYLYALEKAGKQRRETQGQAAIEAGDLLCSRAEQMTCGTGWRGAEKTPLCGMAHGNSGIMIALCRLYRITGEKRYYDLCLRGLDYEDSMYEEEFHDWKDLREESVRQGQSGEQETAWCHGSGGIALSRKLMMDALEDQVSEETADLCGRLEKDIKRAMPAISKHFLKEGMCICHGTMGNYRILEKLREYAGRGIMDGTEATV